MNPCLRTPSLDRNGERTWDHFCFIPMWCRHNWSQQRCNQSALRLSLKWIGKFFQTSRLEECFFLFQMSFPDAGQGGERVAHENSEWGGRRRELRRSAGSVPSISRYWTLREFLLARWKWTLFLSPDPDFGQYCVYSQRKHDNLHILTKVTDHSKQHVQI